MTSQDDPKRQAADRAAFIAAYRDELLGKLADAAMQARHGADLAVWLRLQVAWIDHRLGMMFDKLHAQWPLREELLSPSDRARLAVAPRGYVRPSSNGIPTPQPRKVT